MKTTFGQRVRYAIDNFMARGGLAVFSALMFLSLLAFVVMGTVRVLATMFLPDESLGETGDILWRVFLQISDAGAVAEDGDASWSGKVVGITTIFFGLIIFSSLVAFITNQFDAKIQALRKGKSAVLENGHTLILGWNERIADILEELIIGNESERDAAVAILAEREKEEMDDFIAENISDRKSTRFITRSGSTSRLATLRRMRVGRARSVVVMNEARSSDPAEIRAVADARVLKSIMAVVAGTEGDVPSIVAELHFEWNRSIAENIVPGKVTTLDERSILSKLLVQTSRTSGLAVVYSNLVGFEGNEFYLYRPEAGWGALTFLEIQQRFLKTAVLGFRLANGQMLINPAGDFRPAGADEAVVLAEDDSAIRFHSAPVTEFKKMNATGRKAAVPVDRQLIVGWNTKSAIIIEEYAKYVLKGSSIDSMVGEITDEIRAQHGRIRQNFPELTMRLIQADPYGQGVVETVQPWTYDSVIILARDGDNSEEVDAGTIALLLRFRQILQAETKKTGKAARTQIITEIMDSDNTELVRETGVKDFLISNQFVSRMIAQVSQSPSVMEVYNDLFSPEGSEIYLKRADLYFEGMAGGRQVTYADCIMAATARGETCFGVRIRAEEKDAEKNLGLHIIPPRTLSLRLLPEDELIVLAEDQG